MKRWWPVLVSVLVTPIALFYALQSTDFATGQMVAARALLPWSCGLLAASEANPSHESATLILTLAIAQWPLYGVAVSWRRRWAWYIAGSHILLVLLLFLPSRTS